MEDNNRLLEVVDTENNNDTGFIRILSLTLILLLIFNLHILYKETLTSNNARRPSSKQTASTNPSDKELIGNGYYYDPRDKVLKEVTRDTEFLVYVEGQGLSRYIGNSLQSVLVPTGEDETFVGSLSPDGRYVVYTTAVHIEKEEEVLDQSAPKEEIIESPLKLLDLETGETRVLTDIPDNRTFTGVMESDEDYNYFYYKLRSSSVNPHFPDPETTEFYIYDLRTDNNRYLERASEYTYQFSKREGPDNREVTFYVGHAEIFDESEDRNFFYVRVLGQGTGELVEVWKVNKETLDKVNYYDNREFENGEYHRIRYYDSQLKRLVLEKEVEGVNFTGEFIALNLDTGERVPFENANLKRLGTTYLDDEVIYTTSEDRKKVLVLDRETGEFVREIEVTSDANQEISSPVKTADGRLAFRISGPDDRYGIYDLETKETIYVKKFEPPFDAIYKVE